MEVTNKGNIGVTTESLDPYSIAFAIGIQASSNSDYALAGVVTVNSRGNLVISSQGAAFGISGFSNSVYGTANAVSVTSRVAVRRGRRRDGNDCR